MNKYARYVLKEGYDTFRYGIKGYLTEKNIIDKNTYGKVVSFKNKYKGKKCVLIGSGPSLTMEDLTVLSKCDVVTIACNSLFKAYDFTPWRADLYCIADSGVFKTVAEKALELQQEKPMFVSEAVYNEIDSLNLKNKVYPIRVRCNADYPQKRKFSGNAGRYMYRFGSVLYFMIQLAVYLGFDEIYLLGCDCNYSYTKMEDGTIQKTGDKDYFMPGYEDRKGHQPINQFNIVMPDYDEARRFADKNNIKIFNATRGGKLESFIRVNFDEVFKVEE